MIFGRFSVSLDCLFCDIFEFLLCYYFWSLKVTFHRNISFDFCCIYMHMHIWTHTQISLTNFKLCILYWESWGYVLVKDEHVKHELSQIIPSQKRYQTFIIASLPAVGSSHRCSCDPTTKNVFPQKLVSCGGLDVCSRCLAPFEISVLEDRRTAPAVS